MPIGQFTVAQWRKLTGWLNDGLLLDKLLVKNVGIPTVAAGANSGSGSVSMAPGSTDIFGEVQIVPGSGAALGEMAKITFVKPVVNPSFDPIVSWGTGNKTSGQVSSTINDANTFSIYFSSAPTSGTTYWVSYFNVQSPL